MGNDTLHNVGKSELGWYNNPISTIVAMFSEIGETGSLGDYTIQEVIDQLYIIEDLIQSQNEGISLEHKVTEEDITNIVTAMRNFLKGKVHNSTNKIYLLQTIVDRLEKSELVSQSEAAVAA
jgi:hypothetical protein